MTVYSGYVRIEKTMELIHCRKFYDNNTFNSTHSLEKVEERICTYTMYMHAYIFSGFWSAFEGP